MAGGGGGLSHERQKRGKNSKRKKKKRVGFVLDMTPLVDITFLLLTFFMFTTTMAQPQVMEMSVPPELEEQIDVRESELFSLLIDNDGTIYWYAANELAETVAIKDLKKLAVQQNLKPEARNKLITVLKVATEAPYGLVVNILDELNLAEIGIIEQLSGELRQRKFTIAEMLEPDFKKIEESK